MSWSWVALGGSLVALWASWSPLPPVPALEELATEMLSVPLHFQNFESRSGILQKRPGSVGPCGLKNNPWATSTYEGGGRITTGRSWGDLGGTFCAVRFRIDFLIDFDPKRAPNRRHLGSQNGSQISLKTIQNRSRLSRAKKHSSRPSWKRLEAILSRTWDPSWVIFLIFCKGLTLVS